MSEELKTARKNLGKLADQLESIQLMMRGVESSIPEHAAEAVPLLDVETMDPATEIRAVIGCVVNDYIGPALRDIRDVLAQTKEPR